MLGEILLTTIVIITGWLLFILTGFEYGIMFYLGVIAGEIYRGGFRK